MSFADPVVFRELYSAFKQRSNVILFTLSLSVVPSPKGREVSSHSQGLCAMRWGPSTPPKFPAGISLREWALHMPLSIKELAQGPLHVHLGLPERLRLGVVEKTAGEGRGS